MDYQNATRIQSLLTEAYLARPRNLILSFNVAENDNIDTMVADHRSIIGISSRKHENGDFSLRLFTSQPEPAFDRIGLSQQLGVAPDDLELIVTDGINALNNPIQTRIRPVPLGCSVGHFNTTAGTFGGLVKDDQQMYMLSNNHVLANANQATPGDAILQPGPRDGGVSPTDVMAQLSRFVPIAFTGTNKVDAAIAAIDNLNDIVNALPATNPPAGPIQGITTPVTGMTVAKYGRTTGFTTGTIVSTASNIAVNYKGQSAFFDDQLEIVGTAGVFAKGGDSGSLIFDLQSNQAVGLLFAGTTQGNIFANPISNVLRLLNVNFA